jgi:hypothetical protein
MKNRETKTIELCHEQYLWFWWAHCKCDIQEIRRLKIKNAFSLESIFFVLYLELKAYTHS